MPFSKTTDAHDETYWTDHFTHFLKPLIEQNSKLEARRSQAIRQDLLRQIITDLLTSPVVVADLTDKNANVHWELGVRQSFKHGTVTIIEHRSDLSFDLSTKGTLKYYPDNHLKNESFRESFKQSIDDCLTHPNRADSIVLESVSGRGSLYEIFQRDEATRRVKAVMNELQRNLDVTNRIFRQAEKNKKTPQNRGFVTARPRTPAGDLLSTHRYLEQGDSFYESLSEYVDEIATLNEQLNVWELKAATTDGWLVKYLKDGDNSTEEIIKRFQSKLEAAMSSLTETV